MTKDVAKKNETKSELDKAFVESGERVLDPTLIDKPLLDRMPDPSGWRLLVLPYKGKGVTDGGIQLIKETVDREALSTVICYVLKVGPLAYKDENKFGDKAWSKKGDWILIGRYAGTRFRLEDDHEVRIINDDEVIATILNPDDIKSL
jgi:co-chaperonin GroES (HSP10)|tara:strand:+ start:279 stop:722 length:444 start_codon:yes stop_codon:yes gene_type:complete